MAEKDVEDAAKTEAVIRGSTGRRAAQDEDAIGVLRLDRGDAEGNSLTSDFLREELPAELWIVHVDRLPPYLSLQGKIHGVPETRASQIKLQEQGKPHKHEKESQETKQPAPPCLRSGFRRPIRLFFHDDQRPLKQIQFQENRQKKPGEKSDAKGSGLVSTPTATCITAALSYGYASMTTRFIVVDR